MNDLEFGGWLIYRCVFSALSILLVGMFTMFSTAVQAEDH